MSFLYKVELRVPDQFLKSFVPSIYQGIAAMPKAGWHVLDSSEWSIEETVEQVLRLIDVRVFQN